jgi:hypothetical protein
MRASGRCRVRVGFRIIRDSRRWRVGGTSGVKWAWDGTT